jgi:hypothetical protein
MQGKVEECVKEGRDFYTKAQAMQSPHTAKRARHFVNGLIRDYSDIQIVRDLFDEITAEGEKH